MRKHRNPERLVALRRGEQYSVGPLTFDREGAGVIPNVMDWDYFGFAASIRPSVFLRLASPLADLATDKRTGRMTQGVREGVVFSPISLLLASPSEDLGRSAYRVVGHEGRHRAHQILSTVGDVPVPIVMQLRYARARDLTPETIRAMNKGLYSEGLYGDDEGRVYVPGPIFEGEAIYYADGSSDKRVVKLPTTTSELREDEEDVLDLLLRRNPARPAYKIEKRGTFSDGTPLLGTPLRRVPDTIDPLYTTPDGRFSVSRFSVEAKDFDRAYTAWYWQDDEGGTIDDTFNTKWEAVDALCHYLIEQGLAK